ncbi:MAG: hypothetical protein J0I13_04100 [Rhizobiales bacterium]|nr:hypothetical protein [Hyphomicrobiales bacterium]
MGTVMIRCPRTGRAIPTGIVSDRIEFRRKAVFIGRTYCAACRAEHEFFAREAWVDELDSRTASEAA